MFLLNLEKGPVSKISPKPDFPEPIQSTPDNLDQEYQEFLKKHGFTTMNCPFSSFLRRKELISGIEAGAI